MRCDILTIADGAQVAGNKLYILGGGWRFLRLPKVPARHQIAVAVGLLVDWEETNLKHRFKLELIAEDGSRTIFTGNGEFEQGRPAGTPPGTAQRLLLALTMNGELPVAGPYRVSLQVDGRELASTSFEVLIDAREQAARRPAPD
ncbi:MAG: hypothetical protein ACE5EF_11900 [Dehalococcoidia bacterium]